MHACRAGLGSHSERYAGRMLSARLVKWGGYPERCELVSRRQWEDRLDLRSSDWDMHRMRSSSALVDVLLPWDGQVPWACCLGTARCVSAG